MASASLLLAELPASTGKRLPRYPTVPAVRMGRLAVDQAFKGQGLSSALLADALDRAARSEVAAYALMVDAKDEVAASFYRHHVLRNTPVHTTIASRGPMNHGFVTFDNWALFNVRPVLTSAAL
jgi:GNAT superfamily N-acetyltransferase